MLSSQVGVVMRCAAFHDGSDEAIRILEAARAQDLFEPVLDALLERKSEWASYDLLDLELAWAIAGEAGLDMEAGQAYRQMLELVAILNGDAADVRALGIRSLPPSSSMASRWPSSAPRSWSRRCAQRSRRPADPCSLSSAGSSG